ncbi:MAG: SRPBCC family protein [Bauldia sp.]
MDARPEASLTAGLVKNLTSVERTSDRELVIKRTFDGPARIVFEAWTTPEILRRWWIPRSSGMSFVKCELDARVGGQYRFEFAHPDWPGPAAFFGRYLEVTPPSRLVWTNEENPDASVTTVTLEEKGGKTYLVLHDLYSSKEALDAAMEGMANGTPAQFEQLDDLLAMLGGRAGR